VYDLWRRWFTYRGFTVTLVRNVTDIDDKILAVGGKEEWWALAARIEREFDTATSALGILPPTIEPRATGHIGDMITLISRLVDRGHAYPTEDGTGDVYFSVASWADYGQLTRQSPDEVESDESNSERAKKDPRDFALWKGRKDSEPTTASWDSPWGAGRPGWHIECSAMATRYLGSGFDIHGGGLDLRFPHHENELAQSRAAGDEFATTWLHNGLVTMNGQKMSKSVGNVMGADELLAQTDSATARYFLLASHYRSTMDVHDGSLAEAAAAWDRVRGFARRTADLVTAAAEVPDAFASAMDDDLAVPAALAIVHDTVRAGNTALDASDDAAVVVRANEVAAMLDVLGLDIGANSDHATHAALGTLIDRLITERNRARSDKDWATADRIRDDIDAAGITLEDGADTTRWSITNG
jgi:cysteinyl-tRNA synthetase